MPRAIKPLILLAALISAAALVLVVPTRQYDRRVHRAFSELKIEARTGAAIPFELAGLNGATLTLAPIKGQSVLVNFCATWSEPCRAEMPSTREFRRHFQPSSLSLLALS